MYEIIEELRSNNSSNFKLDILSKYKNNEIWKKILRYTYTYSFNYYIRKEVSVESHPQQSKLTWEDIFLYLDELKNGDYRGNASIHLIKNIKSNLSEEDSNVFQLILDKDIKCGVSSKSINKVYGDLIPTIKYMRCSKLDEKSSHKINFPAIIQKKADGIFCYIIIKNNEVKFYTRNGTEFHCDSIYKSLKSSINWKRNIVFSGELLVRNEEDGREYDRKTSNGFINSLIKRVQTLNSLETKIEEKISNGKTCDSLRNQLRDKEDSFRFIDDNLIYEAWDMISLEEFENGCSNKPYYIRLENLNREIDNIDSKRFTLVDNHIVEDMKEAYSISNEYISNGYEGAILKNSEGIWKDGTSKDQIKMKVVKDIELECIGVEEGSGKYKGMIGSLLLRSDCGNLEVKVGSGLTDEDREKDQSEYIGKIIEIKYNEIILSKSSDKHSLFLPVFVEIRIDKTVADSIPLPDING